MRFDHSNQPINLHPQHIDSSFFILNQVLHSADYVGEDTSIDQLVKGFILLLGDLVDGPEDSLYDAEILRFGVVLDVLVELTLFVAK
jgi:hypothetical protein